MTGQITPGERRELKSVVRQQMRVLRTEVDQRKAELEAEAARRVAEHYRAEDDLLDELQRDIARISADANRQLEDLLADYESRTEGGVWSHRPSIGVPRVSRRSERERRDMHAAMQTEVRRQVSQAKLRLDRQEADLLRSLAADALESDAAKRFLDDIPTVAQLVPSERLTEIEAQFEVAP